MVLIQSLYYTKVLLSNVVCQGCYGEKPCVMTQADTVKDTVIIGYAEELKSLSNCLRNTIKILNYDYLLTTAACQISI